MNDKNDLLDIQQAAEFLNVSETSLRRWTNSGKLACVRLGEKRVRRFRRADLVAFLQVEPVIRVLAPSHADSDYTDILGVKVLHGTHLCSFYTGNTGRAKMASDFLADGLQEGCACYLFSSPSATQEILRRLSAQKIPYQREIDEGRLIIGDYLDNGPAQILKLDSMLKKSVKSGAKCIRLLGNVSESKMAQVNSFEHLLEYERSYETALSRHYPMVSLCQYGANHHSGVEIAEVLKCHKDVFSYPADRLLA